jgi:hypothetical protein
VVQPVDDWNRNHKLALLFEARVGQGRLLACSIDLERDLDRRPGARQLRRGLLAYAAGGKFAPKVAIQASDVRKFLFDTRVMQRLGAKAAGSGAAAIDGDPNSAWLAGGARGPRHPHELVIEFARPVAFDGLILMPRQNHREHEGDVREFELQVDDGTGWRKVHEGVLASGYEMRSVSLGRQVTAQKIRLVAKSGYGEDPVAALGEVAVRYCGPPLAGEAPADVEYRRARSASPDVDEGN